MEKKMATQRADLSDYSTNGECADHGWLAKNQEYFEEEFRNEMRRNGYIPVLDIPVAYTWGYDKKRGVCKFKATSKALKVGSKRSRRSTGIFIEEGIIVYDDEVKPLASF
jgi:hypothetical protein